MNRGVVVSQFAMLTEGIIDLLQLRCGRLVFKRAWRKDLATG